MIFALLAAHSAVAAGLSVDTELIRPTFSDGAPLGLESTVAGTALQQRVGVLVQHQVSPVVLYEWGEPQGAIVSQRATAWLGLGMDLNARTSIRAIIPTSWQGGGEFPALQAGGLGWGDASLGGRYRLGGWGPLRVALRGDLILPTGTPEAWLGEDQPRLDVGVSTSITVKRFRALLEGDLLNRPQIDTGYSLTVGPSVRGAVGAEYRVRRDLFASALLHARAGIADAREGAFSLEPLVGLRVRPAGPWSGQIALGSGVGPGEATSALRALIGLSYAPPVPEAPEVAEAELPDEDALEDTVVPAEVAAPEGWKQGEVTRVAEDRVELREPIQFALGTEVILPQSMPLLRALAELLNTHGEIAAVVIEGHASDEGTFAYNYDLSLRRALAVQRALVEAGVHPMRLSARAMGEVMPRGTALAEDRRVEFHIVAFHEPGALSPVPSWTPRLPWTGAPVEARWPAPPPPPPTDLLEVSP